MTVDCRCNAGTTWKRRLQTLAKLSSLTRNIPLHITIEGMAYKEKGDMDAALSDFTKVIELDPSLVKSALQQGSDA